MQTLADRACPTEGYLRRGEHSAEVFEITRVQVASTRAEAEVHSCAHAGAEGFCPCSSVAWSLQVEREAVLLHGRMCFATPTERPHRQAQLSSGLGHPHVAPEIGKVGSIIGWPGHLLQAEPTGPLRSSLGWPQRRRFFHSDISPEKEIDQG